MALLDVVTGAVFIVNAFKVYVNFLWLRITQRSISLLFQYTTLYICTYHQSLYFSPVSVHNTVYLHISPSALFLSCFSTQHYISALITHRSISLLFQYITLCICTYHYIALLLSCFSTQHCISVHNTHRSISLLFQYTTLYICTYHYSALFLSCFSTQHCISAQCGILCFLNIKFWSFCCFRLVVPYR